MNHTQKIVGALLFATSLGALVAGLLDGVPSSASDARFALSQAALHASSALPTPAASPGNQLVQKFVQPVQQQATPPANTPPGRTRRPTPGTDIISPLFIQAQEALDRNDYDSAIPLLQKIIVERPDEPLPHFELGYAYSRLKRNDEATAEYRRAIALDPTLVAAHLNLGIVLLGSDPAAALESFRRAATLAPDQARPHYLAGEALERGGKLPDAITEYNAGLAVAPRDQALKFALAKALLSAGHAPEAESQFREAIALDRSVVANGAEKGAASDTGDAGSTKAVSAPSSDANFTTPAKLGLAETLLREGKTAEAAYAFSTYLAAAPNDRAARFERSVSLQTLGRLDEALAELDQADRLGTQSADQGAAPAEAFKLRGSIYMQQKNWPAASAALQKAIAISPDDAQLHAWQGHTQIELHNYPVAENELKRSLTLDPKPADVLGDLVNAYYFSGDYGGALQALDLLEKRQPLTAVNWFFRAICCDKLRQTKEAAAAYQKFLDLDQGSHADQDFQARQRLKILERELKR